MKRKTIKVPKDELKFRADIVPDSFNSDNLTVDLVWSTGSKGKRGYFNPYYEELSMKKTDVRLERLNKGAPLLFNHVRGSEPKYIKGRVVSANIKSKEGIATVKLSDREENIGFVRDVETGVITNVSVGYIVHKYEDVTKKNDEFPTYRAIDWEPLEISFVDIPFDVNAQSRSLDEQETYECTVIRTEEYQMTLEEKIQAACKRANLSEDVAQELISRGIAENEIDGEIKRAIATKEKNAVDPAPVRKADPAPAVDPTPAIDTDAIKEQARLDESTRISEIRSVAKDLGLEETTVDDGIKNNTSVDEFRSMAIKMRAEKDKKVKTTSQHVEVNDMGNRELRMAAVENALLHKSNKKRYELTKDGKDFRFMKLTDLARKFLESDGVNTSGLSDSNVADTIFESRSHTTSDFKEILANVANKSLRDAYDLAAQTFAPIVNEIEVNDFKEISRTQLHSGAGLSKVNESGEYEETTLSESAEKYSLQTYGKIISITRKTLVNDDLNAFTRVPSQMGMKSRSLESKLIWAIITSNPLMSDGFNLFSTEHGNIGTGVINVTNVNTGMSKMMLQTDLDGELVDVMPNYLVGPTALGATIKSFLGLTMPTQDSEVNPFKGDLDPIIERRLDASSALQWYLMSSASMIDMIEVARLSGEAGPVITQKEGFNIDGLQIKVRYDFGAKVLDHRGFYRSTGA